MYLNREYLILLADVLMSKCDNKYYVQDDDCYCY